MRLPYLANTGNDESTSGSVAQIAPASAVDAWGAIRGRHLVATLATNHSSPPVPVPDRYYSTIPTYLLLGKIPKYCNTPRVPVEPPSDLPSAAATAACASHDYQPPARFCLQPLAASSCICTAGTQIKWPATTSTTTCIRTYLRTTAPSPPKVPRNHQPNLILWKPHHVLAHLSRI